MLEKCCETNKRLIKKTTKQNTQKQKTVSFKTVRLNLIEPKNVFDATNLIEKTNSVRLHINLISFNLKINQIVKLLKE